MGKKKEPLVEAEEAPPPYYEATAPPASQIIIYEASDNVAYKDTPMQVTLDKTEPSILSKTRFYSTLNRALDRIPGQLVASCNRGIDLLSSFSCLHPQSLLNLSHFV